MRPAKILVVEDEYIVAIDIQISLIKLGYDVPETVDSGEAALEKVLELQPDLVIMDIYLSGEMDGIEAARQISESLNVPIVYLTAYADEATLARAKLTAPFGYILKPFEERELRTAIEIALYKHESEQRLREKQQWLSTILKSIGDAVIANDIEGNITFMNPVAETLTGWKQEEAIGQAITQVFNIVDENYHQPIESPVVAALRQGITVGLPEHTLLLAKNGVEKPIDDSAAPIKDESGSIKGVVLIFRDITEKKQAQAELLKNAFYDKLTGLPNRAFFTEDLQKVATRPEEPERLFAVLFLDIDRFKWVNDSLGHRIGDQLLIAIARRLEASVGEHHTVARLGGDEFAILLKNLEDADTACRTAERILQELGLPFSTEGCEVFVTASIGIALSPISYDQPEDIIRNADIAMYRAKSLGKDRYEVFDRVMYTQVRRMLELENDLRRAIVNQEFKVYYQPIVSISTNKIISLEALVRWQHPARGLVSPAEFIPLAEETGLIVLIDWWVLREACFQMQKWQEQIAIHPPLSISVNLSSKQFVQPNLVAQVQQILKETGLDAHRLRLEITESALIDNTESATAVLWELKTLGIQLSIDDFGTGYSSLSYLHRFPIDTMKIDRSFISSIDRDRENLEIVRAIVMLAHNLGMDVIAEGVETAAQLAKIAELQCESGQGYWFTKPLEAAALEAFLASF
ncbi:MAG: EAL domain-containing protein [Actinomycetota bacterium]